MSSYIYTMHEGADPGCGWVMNDPIFGKTPTLGACVPNIRRAVNLGDWIFVVSGRAPNVQQFVVGGFRVADKINHLAAYDRFPDYRIRKDSDGHVEGNIIVTADGKHHPADNHDNFERRIENYIVGSDPIVVEDPASVQEARHDTLRVLSRIFEKEGNRVFDIIGRARKMDDHQVTELRAWLDSLQR